MIANKVLELQKKFVENGKNPTRTWEDYLAVFMYLSVIELLNRPHIDKDELINILGICGTCVTLILCDMVECGILKTDDEGKLYFKETDETK